jgi:hypothetical protein
VCLGFVRVFVCAERSRLGKTYQIESERVLFMKGSFFVHTICQYIYHILWYISGSDKILRFESLSLSVKYIHLAAMCTALPSVSSH